MRRKGSEPAAVSARAEGAPWVPPDLADPGPPTRDPAQRRFDRLMVGVMLLLIAALVGGLLLFTHFHNRPPAATRARADVEKAYLAWWGAVKAANLQLDTTSLKPHMTAKGLQIEDKIIGSLKQQRTPVRVAVDHNYQIVVYGGETAASVDDVWIDHSVSLDPITMTPTQPDPALPVHESFGMRKENGSWLVDGIARFGVAQPMSGQVVSWAAAVKGQPLPEALRNEIGTSYLAYWKADAEAFLRLDPSLLEQVEIGPALDNGRALLAKQRQRNEPLRFDAGHNYRIAIESDDTAWTYDTILDNTVAIDAVTRRPIESPRNSIIHSSYRLRKGPSGWQVDFVLGND